MPEHDRLQNDSPSRCYISSLQNPKQPLEEADDNKRTITMMIKTVWVIFGFDDDDDINDDYDDDNIETSNNNWKARRTCRMLQMSPQNADLNMLQHTFIPLVYFFAFGRCCC